MRHTAERLLAVLKLLKEKNKLLLVDNRKWPQQYTNAYVGMFIGTNSRQAFELLFAVQCNKGSLDPYSEAHAQLECWRTNHPPCWTVTDASSVVKYCQRHAGAYYADMILEVCNRDLSDPSCVMKAHARLREFDNCPPLRSSEPL